MSALAEKILSLSNRWMGAWLAGDRATLEQMLAPDYALIVSALPDRRFDREAWLATCETYIATTFTYSAVQVRELAPGLVVMSALADQVATLDGADRSGRFFITDVWRQVDRGRWQVCARYTSSPEPPRASVAAMESH